MKSFREHISFWSVTDVLISKRVQFSDKRHKKSQLHLLSPAMDMGKLSATEQQMLSMMPPRKSWVTLSRTSRFMDLNDGEGHRQHLPAAQCNRKAIKWTIKRDLAQVEKPPYLVRLQDFVRKIEVRVQDKAFVLNAPELFPEKKDETSCRPLCKFMNLEDSVIVILANKYLTELFNGLFYDESLAFRSKRTYHGQKEHVTAHHDAIARLKEYRKRFPGQRLYVSECDLQKFYDTVSHKVVRKCYYSLLKRVAKKNPVLQFDEVNRIFEAYLRCYRFPSAVYKLNDKQKFCTFWDKNHIDEECRRFKWVEPELLGTTKRGMMRMSIGVPQGGALSGLIANIVLNVVDWQMKDQMTGRDLYLRYCDDMIILSTSQARCRKLFSIYYKGTKMLCLVPHQPEKNLSFGTAAFWKGKSKDAYLWDMGRKNASEWIGFVGYEIRRDGAIRIRKKSFRKELDKQVRVVFEKTLDKIKGEDRASDDSLQSSLENRLISMSVGKIAVWNADYLENEMCWSDGFRQLEMNPVVSKQLRELDRHRGWILSVAARRIDGMKHRGVFLKRKDLGDMDNDKNPDAHGMVHSYYYQFAKKKGY